MIVAILNPRARRDTAAHLAGILTTESARLRLEVSEKTEDMPAIVERIKHLTPELLVVAGGDGTLQSVLTAMDRAGALESAPPMLLLPAGSVNVTASALVGVGRADKLAARILPAWTRGVRRLARLPVLAVTVGDAPPLIGVTASFGAVGRLHSAYEHARWPGAFGVAEVIASLLVKGWWDGTFRAIEGPIEADPAFPSGQVAVRDVTAGVCSPLARFFLGMRPFPHTDGLAVDAFHVLLSQLGPFDTRRALPDAWRGRLLPAGFESGTLKRLAWTNDGLPDLIALDGEQIEVPPYARVEVRVRGSVRVVAWTVLRAHAKI